MKTSLVLPFLSLICFLYISVKLFVHYGDSYSASGTDIGSSITGSIDVDTDPSSSSTTTISSSGGGSIFTVNSEKKTDKTMDDSSNKTSWPEVVGKMTGEDAKRIIEDSNPTITNVQILPEDSIVTMDYSESRVRIFVNSQGIVAMTPRIG